jgi:hypothetical protein
VTRAIKAFLAAALVAVLPATMFLWLRDGSPGRAYSPLRAHQEFVAAEATGALKERLDAEWTFRQAVWVNGEHARAYELYLQEQARQAEERAAAERAAFQARRNRPSSGTSGGCGVPQDDGSAPPAGFPADVIQRESGGSTTASNGTHVGRAQIACSHYAAGGGCVGLSYNECWTKLWAGGAGASNWRETMG